jgi:hypothetical protein
MEHVVGGVGAVFVRVGQGAGHRVVAKDLALGVDLADVVEVVGAFVFEAGEVFRGDAAQAQESGQLPILVGAAIQVDDGLLVGRVAVGLAPGEAPGMAAGE